MGACKGERNRNRDQVWNGRKRGQRPWTNPWWLYHDWLNTLDLKSEKQQKKSTQLPGESSKKRPKSYRMESSTATVFSASKSWGSRPAGFHQLREPHLSVTPYSLWHFYTYNIYKTKRLESCSRQASHCGETRIVAFFQHVLITREIFSIICNPATTGKKHVCVQYVIWIFLFKKSDLRGSPLYIKHNAGG